MAIQFERLRNRSRFSWQTRPIATYLRAAALSVFASLLVACASVAVNDAPGNPGFDSRGLVYDELVIEFAGPSEASFDVGAETSGDGTREGLKMMMAAPVECMRAGILYGFCLIAAPLMPILAGNRVQEPETSQIELERLAGKIDLDASLERFRQSLTEQARQAGLPLVDAPTPSARLSRLRAELGVMRLEHDGHKAGTITMTQDYRFTLLRADDSVETLIEGERSARFDAVDAGWEHTQELTTLIERWMIEVATKGLRDTLLEWQPQAVLGALSPEPITKRNVIGVLQTRWPFVESTTPTLRWRSLAETLDADIMAEVTDVSYQIEVFQPGQAHHAAVTGLPTPEFAVTPALHPCAYYYWRPRAHFRYRGVVHTTSLNQRRWAKGVFLDDDYRILTPAPDCDEPSWLAPEPEPD